ncbi:Bacterial Transmembrane Pair family protein [Vibrio thalassae]|uniref:Bacterial Transmembrane Pair family protein n=1 Tax=Vibrio thalassae TaxID=1243014 RepID=A0A240EPJ4_9VIBR|nr:PACE efflux transporter [Vibrio thalassae]SNX50019.1 Bacterial Transmembrane Pair family protein [Vibrio thalassae]
MASKSAMRSPADWLRHTILFELLLLLIAAPICMFVFGANVKTAAFTAFSLSLIAMVWNYIYNYVFYRALMHLRGTTKKTPTQRIYHALLFEIGLLVATIPMLAWSLNLTLIDAILADLGFVVVALFYAYFFNLVYDAVFPIADTAYNQKAL